MDDKNWIETEREYEFNNEGQPVPKKVKYVQGHFKPSRKELIDFSLKFIGSVSILVPLLLILFQRKNEIDKENRLALTSLYTDFSKDVTFWNNARLDTTETLKVDSIYNVYIPRINVYGNDSLSNRFSDLYQQASIINALNKYELQLNSVFNEVGNFYNFISPDTMVFSETYMKDSTSLLLSIKALDSMRDELSDWKADLIFISKNDEFKEPQTINNLDTLLKVVDSTEHQIFTLTDVMRTIPISYNEIRKLAQKSFLFSLKDRQPISEKNLYKYWDAVTVRSVLEYKTFTRSVKQFQLMLLKYIR